MHTSSCCLHLPQTHPPCRSWFVCAYRPCLASPTRTTALVLLLPQPACGVGRFSRLPASSAELEPHQLQPGGQPAGLERGPAEPRVAVSQASSGDMHKWKLGIAVRGWQRENVVIRQSGELVYTTAGSRSERGWQRENIRRSLLRFPAGSILSSMHLCPPLAAHECPHNAPPPAAATWLTTT